MAVKKFSGSGIKLMPLLFLYNLLLLLFPQHLSAQTQPHHPPKVEGDLYIIAVRAEFQPDENRFTSGNGTFSEESLPYLVNPGTHIDPLPHDQAYFEAHLEFAKNYFERQSKNQLNIHYQVLPDVYRLDKPMESYSPIGEDPDLHPLAELAADVWQKVGEDDTLPVNLNPQDNIAFVIFHAGVGRDIELTGTTLDKTPQDIPSIYLDTQTLRTLLGDNSFTGFPINSGNLLVNNTLILPRTLSRPGEDITGNRFVLPLSLNGMVTAQIGSHLGLPDLFNTKTGESGIGRFGLMDGAGIFSYNGLFPPELSAFEKIYLGWETPFITDYQTSSLIHLPAASLREENSIAKIPISSDEYFLVENRHRDPVGNGVRLTIQTPEGSLQEVTFTNSDEKFTSHDLDFDKLLPPGVVVDVSNYDFSLPGGLDPGPDRIPETEDDRELNGGILIWHIDESVIKNTPEMKGVNDNPGRRAVSLKEADGAQDIGRPASIGILQNEVNGSAFDFWWDGNDASVVTQNDTLSLYQNRFGPDTTPDNKSNSGGTSFFELYDFTDNLPFAGFRIRQINSIENLYRLAASSSTTITAFTPADDDYWKRYPLAMVPYENAGQNWILIPGSEGINFYNVTTDNLLSSPVEISALQQPVVENNLNLFSAAEHSQKNEPIEVKFLQLTEDTPEEIWSFFTEANSGFLSTDENSIIDIDGTSYRADLEARELLYTEEAPSQRSSKKGDYQSVIRDNNLTLYHPGGSEEFPLPSQSEFMRAHTGLIETSSGEFIFYLLTDHYISIFRPEDNYSREVLLFESDFIDWPAFTDFTGDGNPDFLIVDHTSNQVIGKNINGASLAGFPVRPPEGITFIGTPLVADVNGNGETNLLITGQDNFSVNIYAFNENAESMDGFPLYVGGVSTVQNQPVHPLLTEQKLIAVSHAGDLKIWEFPDLQDIKWSSRYGNNPDNKITAEIETGSPGEINFSLLNAEETYNWPNPAKNETFLRYQTSQRAEIEIVIATLSGRTLYKRTLQSTGGVPEEIQIDTSDWASGGYFALVSAKADGQTERKLVKIAIAK